MNLKTIDCDGARGNIILAMTFAMILGICAMLIYGPHDLAVDIRSSLLILLGLFGKGWLTALDFEFGSSRSTQSKDAAAVAQANKVAAQ